jgi:hypothetical protein
MLRMQARSRSRFLWWIVPLLLSSLACRAATRLIIPDTPTPVPPTPTLVPTATPTPPPTPTPVFQVACPSLLSDIMDAATNRKEPRIIRRSFRDPKDWRYLVTYTLEDDRLSHRKEFYMPDNFKKELDTWTTHEQIWDYFAALIPAEQRSFVTEFSAMSDGQSRILAGVSRTDDFNKWGLRVDVLDASDHYDLTYTLMHEFGHLLTLKSSQVAADKLVIFNPENEKFYERAVAGCPQYFAGDGCSTPGSYINQFFQLYWKGLYEEWQAIDKTKEDETYAGTLHDFYETYADQFLTEYAATSPEEDIAESWASFILASKPDAQSIADEKILFFYGYPELVQLRQEILTRLCADFTK